MSSLSSDEGRENSTGTWCDQNCNYVVESLLMYSYKEYYSIMLKFA